MRINENTTIMSDTLNLVLVPYRTEHVPTYHEWMKDEFLQKMTASEPLTLEEEYEMCESWRTDESKCTFIVLSQDMADNRHGPLCEIAGMIGDVNLYLNDLDNAQNAEIEVMIAEPSARRKGFGKCATHMMMRYGNGLDETVDCKGFQD
ncbi:hypothetical protein BDEG_25302 [Batrachochytrium dendrobatidis JEL423]|uniref:N-acetyltransferase domain-containing protein n=1 Tax=Batrachochytrium dendrobatidis (strain JEL423) TaxID=403673 RepID=A0A177WQ22_BATDL|nr:hypothetical protein BDEG_25302 [Batrachochytrium dendrobatidis JEL423]